MHCEKQSNTAGCWGCDCSMDCARRGRRRSLSPHPVCPGYTECEGTRTVGNRALDDALATVGCVLPAAFPRPWFPSLQLSAVSHHGVPQVSSGDFNSNCGLHCCWKGHLEVQGAPRNPENCHLLVPSPGPCWDEHGCRIQPEGTLPMPPFEALERRLGG